MEHEKYAIGYKNVTINDPFFPGHFPQRAIMPGKLYPVSLCQTALQAASYKQSEFLLLMIGVLQVEAMAQLGGLIMIDPSSDAAKNNFFFGGVDNCKWRRPVVPGDCLVRVNLH